MNGEKLMKKGFLLLTIFISVSLVIFLSIKNKPIYGNDADSIVEVISSINLYEGKSIHLLEIYDFDDDRVVTFLSNSSPSIIEFDKNDKGNYTGPRSETRHGENLSQFTIGHIGDDDEVFVFSVKNQYSTTDMFSFSANTEIYTVDFGLGHPNSHYTKLKKSKDNSYSFEWFIPEE